MANEMTSEEIKEIAKKERCAVVQHRSGPAIVVAGPGSGKTTTLAGRFISLCQEDGYDPSCIVAVTFTNHAADQMKKKVTKKFGESKVSEVRIGTLHSLAKRLLHLYSDRLNLPSTFRVVGRLQEALLLADVRLELKGQNLKLGRYQNKYLARFKASKAFIPDLNVIAKLSSERGFATQELFDECYSSFLRYYKSVDWYDVIALAVKLLQEHEDILSKVAGGIDHLLVDEYQDLNRADHELIRLLATKADSLVVFGDDDQSIYQTGRFANPGGIKNFKNVYRNAKVYPLSVCWRCASSILDAAWKMIDVDENRMPERMPKEKPIPNPERGCGEFEIRPLKSEKAEIQTILTELEKELNSDQLPKDILVLFHSREIGRKYVETMLSNDLNVKNLLGQPHTASKAVLLLYETLRLLDDESDSLAARFLLQELFEQGASWIAKRRRASQHRGISLWQSVIANANIPQAILSWSKKLQKWRQMDNVVEILTELASVMGIDDDPEIKKIIEWSREQESIAIHKIIVGLERGFEFEGPESEETEEGCVIKVMTMHGVKGIDADVVFVPALEDELIPNQWYEPEQRRLLYVSMTRAKRRLLLSWAWSRTGSASHRSSRRAEIQRDRSRFLEDMERVRNGF